jgi:hypothetical protein
LKVQSAEAVVHLMVARDPHQSADVILAFLMGVNGARAGAVFSVQGGRRLFVGHGIDEEAIDWTAQCWSRSSKTLQQGRLARSDDRFLIPIVRGERLAALVYLATAHVDLGSIAEVSGLIFDAVTRSGRQPAPPSPVETYLQQTPSKEIERRKLVILLDQHEWNVARVARELQVTRTTVYKRLEAFGIARKRVAKDGRNPCSVPSS